MIAVLLLIKVVYTLVFEEGKKKSQGGQGNFPLEISFHISSLHDWPVPLLITALPLVPMNAVFSEVSATVLSKCLMFAFRTRDLP